MQNIRSQKTRIKKQTRNKKLFWPPLPLRSKCAGIFPSSWRKFFFFFFILFYLFFVIFIWLVTLGMSTAELFLSTYLVVLTRRSRILQPTITSRSFCVCVTRLATRETKKKKNKKNKKKKQDKRKRMLKVQKNSLAPKALQSLFVPPFLCPSVRSFVPFSLHLWTCRR
jgi:hypothetical protein